MHLRYPIGQSGQALVFDADVLAHFQANVQSRFWHPESGGQLFAVARGSAIHIVRATGPRPTDRRGRIFYKPDRRAEQTEIEDARREGLLFVGDWHTHPQNRPSPSGRDHKTIRSIFEKSRLDVQAIVMIIVGRSPFPEGLYVSVTDGNGTFPLSPEP